MNMRATILAQLLLIPTCAILAQSSPTPQAPKRTIEVLIHGAAKDTIYLANYYGNKLFYADTAVADAKGRVVFKAERGYKAGVYAVVVPGPKYFEMVVNEPVIKLETDKQDLLGKLRVIESPENELFLGYIRFLNERKLEGDALRARLDGASDPLAKGTIRGQLEELDRDVKSKQKALVEKNPGRMAAMLVHMGTAVELPEIRKANGNIDSAATYYQFRRHFWDHFDLKDERIVRIPVFANKFEEYIGRVIPQVPDTITRLVDELIARAEGTEEVFKYMVHTVTHKYETSDIMGMDAVFAHMALTYYCPGKNGPGRATWMEAEQQEKLCERARKLAPLTLGRKAPNLILTDTTEKRWIGMHDLPNEYILLVFWDPHCGVCKKELPKIKEVYDAQLKAMDVEVFCVAKAVDETLLRDWKKFIREKELDWVNVGLGKHVYEEAKKDPRKFIPAHTTIESLNYAETFDVYSTPKMFLLDGERRFVGKQLTPEQVVDLVSRLRDMKAKQ
jgi:thiol-disulfide isomerase/thioredoxin